MKIVNSSLFAFLVMATMTPTGLGVAKAQQLAPEDLKDLGKPLAGLRGQVAIGEVDGGPFSKTATPHTMNDANGRVLGNDLIVVGFLDRITNGIVYGWACDEDAQDKSIKVRISLGTEEGVGDLSFEVTASEMSEKAIADYCCHQSEVPCIANRESYMHRFSYALTKSDYEHIGDGRVYAYGIGAADSRQHLLVDLGLKPSPALIVLILGLIAESLPARVADVDIPNSIVSQCHSSHQLPRLIP